MGDILEVNGLCAGYGNKDVLKDITFRASKGQFISLLGPNGSGKTTLFLTLLGILKTSSGSIFLEGKSPDSLPPKQLARVISFIPQVSSPLKGFTVEEIVSMGRHPYGGDTSGDIRAIEEAIKKMDLSGLRDKDISRISGGEYQRVLIARSLAQGTQVMLLDEPTAHLDIKYQIEIAQMLKAFAGEKLIIGAFHDINLVKNYADRVIMMRSGKVVADGSVSQVLTADIIKEVFDVSLI